MVTKLLPCPFCGCDNASLNAPSEHWKYGCINCPACMAVVPGAVGGFDRETELVGQWNSRSAQQEATQKTVLGCPKCSRRYAFSGHGEYRIVGFTCACGEEVRTPEQTRST